VKLLGRIALKSIANGQFVCADLNRGADAGDRPLYANRANPGSWETFEAWDLDGSFAAPPAAAGGEPIGGAVIPPVGDAIDLGAAMILNSPPDIAAWRPAARITALTMDPVAGLTFEFSTKASWPEYMIPGWTGPIQYTVWAMVEIAGGWFASGFIQMWKGRAATGAPILSEFRRNWAYDKKRWGAMADHAPQIGEPVGFMVSAGNARNERAITSVRERSQVVVVPLPAGDRGTFTF
jgi:hypothetical protein